MEWQKTVKSQLAGNVARLNVCKSVKYDLLVAFPSLNAKDDVCFQGHENTAPFWAV